MSFFNDDTTTPRKIDAWINGKWRPHWLHHDGRHVKIISKTKKKKGLFAVMPDKISELINKKK